MGKDNTIKITEEEALEILRERLHHLRETTDFFDTLFKSMGGYAVIASDFDGNILTYNKEVIKYYGYTQEEIVGGKMNIEVFFPKDFIETEKLQQAIENTMANGTYLFEEENVKKDGCRFPAQVLLVLVRSKDGTMFGFIVIVQDLTERKRWEMEIKKLNEDLERRVIERTAQLADAVKKFETEILMRKQSDDISKQFSRQNELLLNSAGEGIYGLDLQGNTTFLNPAAARMLGWNREELIGKHMHSILHHSKPDGTPYMSEDCPIYAVLRDGTVHQVDTEVFWRKDGTSFPVRYISTPIVEQDKVVGAVVTFEDITERKHAEDNLQRSYEKLRRTLEETAAALSSSLEMRDAYTGGHQRRVTRLARAIASEMGLPEEQIDGIRIAGILHDIGKIAVPAEILSKPGKLGKIEFELIKSHANAGYEILKDIEFPWPIAQIVLQHHERMDGSGYPAGLLDGKILIEARILCVSDVVEAMASHRPYRAALGIDAAMEEITQKRGILYDTAVVDVCVRLFKEKGFKFE